MIAVMADAPMGKRIRLRRQALKLTQQELADRLGVNRATVSMWERGRQLPQRTEGAIEAVLGISLSGDRDDWYDENDPIERGIAEDPRLPEPVRRDFVAQLRAKRLQHIPRAHEPPAL
jgi:transcriptional regulator with XRE-family HTH domain